MTMGPEWSLRNCGCVQPGAADAGFAGSFHLVWIGCLLANVQTGAAAIRGGGMHVPRASGPGCVRFVKRLLVAWWWTVWTARRRSGVLR